MTDRTEEINKVLEDSKGIFDEVIVVGLKKGVVDVVPSLATYPFCQWLLDRAKFELLISEKASLVVPESNPT